MAETRSRTAPFSRRHFLATGLTTPALIAGASAASAQTSSAAAPKGGSTMLDIDFRKLVSRADLNYQKPASRSEDGMPVGNGRMGSLIWTDASALKFQINRVDVYPISASTNSFPERNTDYSSGCGYVDIDLGDTGEDLFQGPEFQQQLSVYDALMTARAKGVSTRALAWNARDVMAVEVNDTRSQPTSLHVNLRMLRYTRQFFQGQNWDLTSKHTVMVRRRSHTAASRLEIRGGRILLIQEFREGDHYCASAVAIGVVGRKSRARYADETTVRLSSAPAKGRYTVLIGSAASFDPNEDVGALALKEIEAAEATGFDGMAASNQTWWHDYWSKAFIRLSSADGNANFVEQHYTYFLYIMGSSSRGGYPPRFGGMLWATNGDLREWGAMHWWANTSCYYSGLLPANRPELMDPMFSMYFRNFESLAVAARQQWGSQGIWIPETCWFNGMEKLPDDIAAEMRELYLMRKSWSERSKKFDEFSRTKLPSSSRWNWIGHGKWVEGRWEVPERGAGPFGPVTHIMSGTAAVAFQFWLRYQYTQDKAWLRDRAYPMIKAAAEFYRNFPNVTKDADGKFHIRHVNNGEPVWDTQDTQMELAAIRGITPVAIRASEILDVDPELRPLWREFVENLAPFATNELAGTRKPDQPVIWIGGLGPAKAGLTDPLNAGAPAPAAIAVARPGLSPVGGYDLCTLETDNPEMMRIANATHAAGQTRPVDAKTPVSVLSGAATTSAYLGRADDIKHMLPNQLRCLAPEREFCDWAGIGKVAVLANRLSIREGPGAIEAQRMGRVTNALHHALLQSTPPGPGRDPVIRVFPAWPKEWDAQFTLIARGAFLVTASMEAGAIEFVELLAKAGGECRLRNPWGDAGVTLYRNGKKAEDLTGSLLRFATAKDEVVVAVPAGGSPDKFKRQRYA